MFYLLGKVFKGQYRVRVSLRVTRGWNDLDAEPESLLVFKNMLDPFITVSKLIDDIGTVGTF